MEESGVWFQAISRNGEDSIFLVWSGIGLIIVIEENFLNEFLLELEKKRNEKKTWFLEFWVLRSITAIECNEILVKCMFLMIFLNWHEKIYILDRGAYP